MRSEVQVHVSITEVTNYKRGSSGSIHVYIIIIIITTIILLLSYKNSLDTYNRPSSDIRFENTIPHSSGCLFTFFLVSFDMWKCFNFYEV